ncbi:MAG: thioredoxin family protein [Euryarchaeota archaeon]|nr:thioredoxin family protein [Euryarchaeota archaeon]
MAIVDVATAEEFRRHVLEAKEPTVVMFWAAWCPFCRAFKPTFDRYADKYGARFARVSLDEYDNPLWDSYAVNVVPSLAYFQDGALTARKDGRLGRGLTEAELDAFLRQVLPAARAT